MLYVKVSDKIGYTGILVYSVLFLALTSCKDRELCQAFRELDRAIEQRQSYVDEFEHRNDILRTALSNASTADESCDLSASLFDAYKHFNLDSAARYNQMEKIWARSAFRKLRSCCNEIYETSFRGGDRIALERYRAIDTSGMSVPMLRLYLETGIEIMKNMPEYEDELMPLRRKLASVDTLSYAGRKNLANLYRAKGQNLKALGIFFDCMECAEDIHDLISISYNIANIYGEEGYRDKKELWLAKVAVNDLKAPNRDYKSLYQLSLMLLDDGDLERAAKYINIHYADVSGAYFFSRVQSSGIAEQKITSAYLQAVRSRQLVLLAGMFIIAALSVMVFVLYGKNNRKRKALQKAHEELTLSDKIKENYIFRYMMLSQQYMDQAAANRYEYNRILKEQGPECLARCLRSADKEYSAQKEFYRFFDEAFLNIYPDFVSEVNSLLRPEARFDESAHTLPTEIRILAVMRLGISASPDIAKFLKCALPTVYTYRAKLRNMTLCKKEDFEQIIMRKNL